MHAIARELPEFEAAFTPFYGGAFWEGLRCLGLMDFTILGNKLRRRCLRYLSDHRLAIDVGGSLREYDLVVTCTDLFIPGNVKNSLLVTVQEGILDPPSPAFEWVQRFSWVPRWMGGTAATGLSGAFDRFCVASAGYRDFFIETGVDPELIRVTGIPNFDHCEAYLQNSFPRHGYVLACTSDARETFKKDDREALVKQVLEIAGGRSVIFKLHPNENIARARSELSLWAPEAEVWDSGSAEEMVANCSVLVTQYSSLAFVGVALGKEVHSLFSRDELDRLLPEQNGGEAARNIAQVCRELWQEAVADSGERRTRRPIINFASWLSPEGAAG